MTFQEGVHYVRLSDIQFAKRNPKAHDLDAIRAAIQRWGFVALPIADARLKGCRLVAGHGRVTTLRMMRDDGEPAPGGIVFHEDDEWMVPVLFKQFRNAREAEAYLLADNRLTELGAWGDGEQLAQMLDDLAGEFEGTGFTQQDADDLAAALADIAPPSITVGDVADIGKRYELVVECPDEATLAELYDRMDAEGFHCRTLIL